MSNVQMDDAAVAEKSLTVVKTDNTFKLLPVEIQKSVDNLFLPKPAKAGDLSGRVNYWSPGFTKLVQKDSGIEGDPRRPGIVVGDGKPFPKSFSIIPLIIWYSRNLFARPGMEEKGLCCKSPDGRNPAGIENPKSSSCFRCPYAKGTGVDGWKCKVQINVAGVTVQDPIGVHILNFKGASYMVGDTIHRHTRQTDGEIWQTMFTLTTSKETRDNMLYYTYQIEKYETIQPEWRILLAEIQKRTNDWIVGFINREKGIAEPVSEESKTPEGVGVSASEVKPETPADTNPVT